MNRPVSNRYLWFGLIAVVLLLLLSLLMAPSSKLTNGSTFSRAPDGYLSWYRDMIERGVPIERWQRSPNALIEQTIDLTEPQTLIQIQPQLADLDLIWGQGWVEDWLEGGNRLIILGVRRPVTAAPFTTEPESSQGRVTIQTRRREHRLNQNRTLILGDDQGAVVWQETRESGTVTFSTAPHLAANAYQSASGNYDFLAALVTEASGSIWIDEYLHGYREAEEIVEAIAGDWMTYLTRTPVLLAVLQIGILVGILILAQNQRPGPRSMLKPRPVDNSQAYIQALAGVLRKARGNRFVTAMIAKAEQLHLQKGLGLGETSVVDQKTLKAVWVQKTGQAASELDPLLTPPKLSPQTQEHKLLRWLTQLQQIRRRLGTLDPRQR